MPTIMRLNPFVCSLLLTVAVAATASAQYTAADIGNPQPPGTVTPSGNGFDITAGGGDIGGVMDQFTFNYQSVTGDFDVKIRVSSLSLADSWTKAGLMARATLSSNSAFAATFATPSASGAYFASRSGTGVAVSPAGNFPVNYPNTWLRLQRVGNQFTGYGSFDGNSWVQIATASVSLPGALNVGMAVCSRTNGVPATAQIRDHAPVVNPVVVPYAPEIEPAGPSSRLTPFAFTEIMYNPFPSTNGSGAPLEFVELYNSNPFFEEISGYRISGDIDYTFPPSTFLQGGAYVVVARDPAAVKARYGLGDFDGRGGVISGAYSNSLPGTGTVRLRNKENAILLEVPYSSQPPWPAAADGAGHSLVLARPSYGERDPFAWGISGKVGGSPGGFDALSTTPQQAVVINEFFANSEPPDEDFVELYNHSNQEVDISGCTLSDAPHTNKFVFPNGTTIPARGFRMILQTQLGFGLGSGGETIYFRSADGSRVLDSIRFDAQSAGISSGRSPDGAREIYPLKSRTPGAANAGIFVHDIVINEIMYRPVTGLEDDEYVELYNQGTNPVSLAGWKFVDGISYTFPTNAQLAPKGFLVVAENVGRMITNYPNLNANNTYGNFGGSLRNRGDRVALARPDINITTNGMGEVKTNTVYVVVDEVTYRSGGNWPRWANEGGSSLELIDPRSNHRLAHNWADSDETQKAPWSTVEAAGIMDNGSDVPTWTEILALNEGEYLVDNYELIHSSGGTNILSAANSTFENGLGNWFLRGTHRRSSLETTGGFGGGQCLHLRATARGDTMYNRALCIPSRNTPIPGIPSPPSGTLTMRAKVRWLRGWPEILLRLQGNWMEAYGRLTLPSNLGTPGLPNSASASNAAPAIYDVKHAPVVPAANEPVIVTARAHDPDGVQSVVLKYRVDPNISQVSVNMVDDGTGGDAIANDGVFTGTIPGQPQDTMIAYQVTATDTRNAARLFPLQYPNYDQPFECMVRFGDPVISSGFATYRQWMSVSNVAFFSSPDHPALSNERVYETLVYGNFRAIHNVVMKWAGSPYHQFTGSPVTTPAHYVIDIPPDDLFLGTDGLSKIHGPGNSPFDDNTLQREQLCYWMARQLGLPWNYRRFVNVYFNGNRRGGTTAMMEDSVTPGDDVVDAYFPDDTDGDLYKIQPWFEQGDPTSGANNRAWTELDKFTTLSNGIPVHKTARYRHNFLVRAANGTANDFAPVFELIDAAQATNNLAAQAVNLTRVAEMEEWFRIFAVPHAVGDWDHLGYRNAQNMYGYRGKDTKWTLMIWDMNIVLGNSGSDSAGSLTLTPGSGNLTSVNSADSVMPFLYRNAPFRRMYLRALKEICTSVWSSNRYISIIDAKYNAILAGGVTPGNNGSDIKSFIATARTTILNSLRSEDATNFLITSSSPVDTTNNYVIITGQAPVEAKTILINGVEYPITWTSAKDFFIYVPVNLGGSSLVVQGYDIAGNALPGFSTNVTVNSTGQAPPPEEVLRLSEIMYNPSKPDASFVEVYNNSDFAYDLSSWRVNGVDYTFPHHTIITNRQSIVLAKNVGGFSAAYSGAPIFDLFNGNLDNGGETLALEKPVPVYTTNGATIITNILYTPVNRVRYDDDAPWPAAADGGGPSLQLIDANQDNARVSNWGSGTAWLRVSRTTTNIGNATNVLLWLTTAGNCYVDDVSLIGPGGTNIIENGSFESPTLDPWIVGDNYAASMIVSNVSRTGGRSLFVQGAAAGGSFPLNVFQQVVASRVVASNAYTLSFYVLYHTNSVNVNMRSLPGNTLTTNIVTQPIQFSPGAANLFADTLPPYDPLWLNEIQLNSLTGITDNNGQRDPWLELYNSGTNTLDLGGYYLANNYTNLTQWKFPDGTTLGPKKFKVVWLDGEIGQTSGTNLHTNFRANNTTGSVALVRIANGKQQITDYLNYPLTGADLSYGSAPDGQPFNRTILFAPTPGSSNSFRAVNVIINEWMAANTNTVADPADGQYDDWFELYNAGSQAVDLSGYWLTDNLNNHMGYQVPTNGQYVIPPGGFLLVWADGEDIQNSPSRPDLHANFQLSRTGESIGLYAPDGQTAIDTISFGVQTNNISEGRYADGAPTVYLMTTPTPRLPNTLGGGNNHPPTLDPIADRFVSLGQTINFIASATDSDAGQTVTFGLQAGAPLGATISPSGQFHWTPSQSTPATAITVIATDNGVPPANATRTFTVTVAAPPVVSVSGNTVSIAFPTIPGKTYRVDYKNNLGDPNWTTLVPAVVTGSSLEFTDNLGASPQRFYQIVQLN